ncbi:MAG TPA: hypothetical protein VEX64_11570, partial [Pyrinomonadaceae bacterium]|nr:hypothetical protein [Pyrinomonadaceae bacterium]
MSIALCLIAFLSAIWIIVPAPAYEVWLFAVAVSEWSLWLSALALAGVFCGLFVRALYPNDKVWIASLIIGAAAFIISLYPFFSVLGLAAENKVSLSMGNYFAGLNSFAEKKTNGFTTHTFTRAEGKDLQLDVYLPTQNTIDNRAGVIVVHGGSWSGG